MCRQIYRHLIQQTTGLFAVSGWVKVQKLDIATFSVTLAGAMGDDGT